MDMDGWFESSFAFWALVIGILIWSFYYYSTSTFNFWKDRGVPFLKPVPLFGNLLDTALGLRPGVEAQQWMYNSFKGNRFGGLFLMRSPMLMLRDPELIEQVMVKDFSSFYNRMKNRIDPKLDPLQMNLVNLQDQTWKTLRNKLTPVFSSGKLKLLFPMMVKSSDSLVEVLESNVKLGQFDARELMAKFTTDVIGSAAFGLNTDALNNPDSTFRKVGRAIFQPGFKVRFRMAISVVFPWLVKLLGWKQLPQEVEDFFFQLVTDTIKMREVNNIKRNDMLQMMIELRKEEGTASQFFSNQNNVDEPNTKQEFFNDTMMAANSFVFFAGGFETTASTLGYCLFELAQNPDCQDKLRQEVKEVLAKHNGQLTFEAVKEMSYLDNCISETLRMYPPLSSVMRTCSQDYKIPNSDLLIKKGQLIQIPMYSIHHDPDHFPEPNTFKPERFSESNIHKIKRGTYLPFGNGPRICIGKRFAILEIKVGLSQMISKFKFLPTAKTTRPIKFSPKTFFLVPMAGVWLEAERVE